MLYWPELQGSLGNVVQLRVQEEEELGVVSCQLVTDRTQGAHSFIHSRNTYYGTYYVPSPAMGYTHGSDTVLVSRSPQPQVHSQDLSGSYSHIVWLGRWTPFII